MVFGGLFTRLRVLNAIVCSVVVGVVWVCGYGCFGLWCCGWFVVIVVAGAWRSGLLLLVWVDCFLLYMLVLGISFVRVLRVFVVGVVLVGCVVVVSCCLLV